MALQIYTRDMVPQLRQAGTEATARAISQAGDHLGRAFEKLADEHKRTNAQAKAVDAFLGAMTDEQRAAAGVGDMTAFKNLSATDRIAKGTGLLQAQHFQQGQRQIELNGAQLREADARIRGREAEMLNSEKSPAFLSALSRYRQPTLEAAPTGEEGPANLAPGMDFGAALGRATADTGFKLPDSALGRLLAEMEQEGSGGGIFSRDDLGKPRPTGIPGFDYIPTTKGGGQVLDSRPPNPKANDEGTIEIPDPTDPVFGPRLRIPLPVAKRDYPHLLKALDAGKPSAGGAEPKGQPDAELKLATEALAKGVDRKKVAAKYKARTGKDLPP